MRVRGRVKETQRERERQRVSAIEKKSEGDKERKSE